VSDSVATLNYVNPVQEYIPLVEARMREQSNGHHPDLQTALDHLLDSGGKRIRPTITLLVGEMIGADLDRTITLAAAVELLHTATLVHDDVIDGALLRRGTPTLNARWSPGATILTGDFIFARAAKLAAETDSIDVMNLFAKTLSTIVNGEITQLFKSKGLASMEDYFRRIYAKTASMFELAAKAPLYLSDANEEELEAMRCFGYEAGMAFQIVDDILDFTSAQEDVGKPVANDLRQGLITLPALYYFEENPEDKYVQAILIGERLREEDLRDLVSLIQKSGVIDKALQEALAYSKRGLENLDMMPTGVEKQALIELTNFIVNRQI
jgi:geranylgeranyl pyrophosphate synthase